MYLSHSDLHKYNRENIENSSDSVGELMIDSSDLKVSKDRHVLCVSMFYDDDMNFRAGHLIRRINKIATCNYLVEKIISNKSLGFVKYQ